MWHRERTCPIDLGPAISNDALPDIALTDRRQDIAHRIATIHTMRELARLTEHGP
jgi:hypothetical protein